MTTIEVVPAGNDGWPRVRYVDELAFGYSWPDEGAEIHREVLEFDRTVLAVVDGVDAGIASTYSLRMSVPGAVGVPVAGLTWVGVLPTHRRRGVLTAMMRQHLDDLHDNGREAVAALFAAEPAIYGRYGYGLASQRYSVKIPREYARLVSAEDEPTAAFVEAEAVRPQLALVADAVASQRPGLPARNPLWWDRTLDDPPSERAGKSALRTLLVADETGPRAYALYSTKENWGPGGSAGTLQVREVMGLDTAARRAVWRVLLGTDLVGETTYEMLPMDDPLLLELVDPRRAQPRLIDALFVRVVDIDRALTARTYAVDVDVVLEIDDPFCPWNSGRWHLSGGPTGAVCSPTTDAADVRMDATSLGSAYLGAPTLRTRADVGLVVEQRLGAIDAVQRAFASPRAPWCPFIF